MKIEKDRTYTRDYHIKTKNKNTWIIRVGKMSFLPKYDGPKSANFSCAVYYQSEKGKKVLIPGEDKRIAVFNPHFFSRYNERLKLGFQKQIDVIVHFLKYNSDMYEVLQPAGNKTNAVAYSRDGIFLGELQKNTQWLVWKTFVDRSLMRNKQEEKEDYKFLDMAREISKDIEKPFTNRQKILSNIHKILAVGGNVKE